MKKDNSFWVSIIKVILMSTSMLAIFIGVTNRQKEEPKIEKKEEVKQFRKSELILWELFLKEAKQKRFIIEENLKSIELIEIVDYGKYIKKMPNIRYEQINFTYTCKNETVCVTNHFPKLSEDSDIRVATTIIDLTDKEYLEMTGYSFRADTEFVPIDGPFVYEGEE